MFFFPPVHARPWDQRSLVSRAELLIILNWRHILERGSVTQTPVSRRAKRIFPTAASANTIQRQGRCAAWLHPRRLQSPCRPSAVITIANTGWRNSIQFFLLINLVKMVCQVKQVCQQSTLSYPDAPVLSRVKDSFQFYLYRFLFLF